MHNMNVKYIARKLILNLPFVNIRLYNRKNRLTILCIHGVTAYQRLSKTANFESRHIYRYTFADIVEHLLRYFNPIPIGELYGNYYNGKVLPPNPILFTFDDGFANNYHHAFPVLKRLNCPAIIFLATGYMDNKAGFWVERLEYSVHNTKAKKLKITILNNDFDLSLNTNTEKEIAYMTILRFLKGRINFSRIEEAVNLICDQLGFPSLSVIEDNEDYRFLTWDEVKEMARFGISFGAHTVNHANLTYENLERADWEIRTSKMEIEKHLGMECVAFCYPFGRSGYNSEMEDLLKQAGFKFSFQLGGDLNDRSTNPLLLNRIPLGWESKKEDVLWDILSK